MRVERGAGRAAALAVALAVPAAMSVAGCAAPGEAAVEQAPPAQVAVEVDVKRALLASDAVGGAAIGVGVGEGGTVTLSGFVGSEEERAEALRLARDALGGREPVDELKVRD